MREGERVSAYSLSTVPAESTQAGVFDELTGVTDIGGRR